MRNKIKSSVLSFGENLHSTSANNAWENPERNILSTAIEQLNPKLYSIHFV